MVKRGPADMDLGGRRPSFTDSQVHNAPRLIGGGEPTAQAVRDLGVFRAAFYRRVRELPMPSIGVDALTETDGFLHAGQGVDVLSESGSDFFADGGTGFLDGVEVVRCGGPQLGLGRPVRVDGRFQGAL